MPDPNHAPDDEPTAAAFERYLDHFERKDPERRRREANAKPVRGRQSRYARPARVPWWAVVGVAAFGLHAFVLPW